ncbi:enoyl-CoA hydratase/carnithine racemase [Rhizobium sp. BK313]|jgi:enoyl-CoA hydratase/carnithine racemase|uniref:enoyl-CoA hydratase/isomerase family protein n=1 Tax=Rhizobium sp. BK313 TaxID=2587081 RepID=UPI00105F31E9|nr:enoyl-CoA hydratase/isomerase family protein [Rhizobium sp. BK313]MBB3458301.1 enoyl-CoA hydratase/carnithine racemase [Rhizobium sp. BK313]
MSHLVYHIEGNLATITLTNPPQNRLSPQMLGELTSALKAIGGSGARALLLCAEGEDFSFGGDIVPWPDMSHRELRVLLEDYMTTFNQFERLSIPTIAAVQGLCFGGGLELAVRADVIFAGDTARFGHPEQSLAIVTVLGGIYRVAERAGRSRAIEWALTSEQVPAQVMEHHGVVNRVVANDKLFDEAKAFAQKLANGPTRAHAAHKALLRIWATGGIAAADEAMADIAMPLFESEDVKLALPVSVEAFKAKAPRPAFPFKGR